MTNRTFSDHDFAKHGWRAFSGWGRREQLFPGVAALHRRDDDERVERERKARGDTMVNHDPGDEDRS